MYYNYNIFYIIYSSLWILYMHAMYFDHIHPLIFPLTHEATLPFLPFISPLNFMFFLKDPPLKPICATHICMGMQHWNVLIWDHTS